VSTPKDSIPVECQPINVPGAAPGWGCCACRVAERYATYNGEKRTACKHCGHVRCDKKVLH